jgi:hypothetical protein
VDPVRVGTPPTADRSIFREPSYHALTTLNVVLQGDLGAYRA